MIRREFDLAKLYTLALSKDICTILEISIEWELFKKLGKCEVTILEASKRWGLPKPSTRVLGQYLCAIGLLHYKKGKLSNAPVVYELLVKDLLSLNLIYNTCKGNSLKNEVKKKLLNPVTLNWYQMRDQGKKPDETDLPNSFYEGLHEWRIRWGEELANLYDFTNHKVFMDVGGASAGWCIGILNKCPHLKTINFDILPACEVARKKIKNTKHSKKVEIISGDFFNQSLPIGSDVILLANVLHDWTIDDDRRILREVYQALPKGGVLLVKEFFVENDWSGSVISASEAFRVLGAEGRSGWQPSYKEMELLLEEEGFTQTKQKQNLIVAKKS